MATLLPSSYFWYANQLSHQLLASRALRPTWRAQVHSAGKCSQNKRLAAQPLPSLQSKRWRVRGEMSLRRDRLDLEVSWWLGASQRVSFWTLLVSARSSYSSSLIIVRHEILRLMMLQIAPANCTTCAAIRAPAVLPSFRLSVVPRGSSASTRVGEVLQARIARCMFASRPHAYRLPRAAVVTAAPLTERWCWIVAVWLTTSNSVGAERIMKRD